MIGITNFLKELRRRNVFKVSVAYAIVAWLLIQVASITFPALHLPAWAITLVTVLVLFGFPIALLLAWAFELTPEGVKSTHQASTSEAIANTAGRKFDFIIIGLLLVAVIMMALDNYVWIEEDSPAESNTITKTVLEEKIEPADVEDRKSVAVLPFANRSAEKKDAYFADGLHDDLLTHLSKINDMKVISRTSVMQYRNTEKSMKVIGDELDVATLLEGGVQRAGNQIRINVQLIDANTDEHLWAEIYDRELTAVNIFAIQSEIASAIANALRATLSVEERQRIAAVPTKNLAAYDAYLIGKQRMRIRTSGALAAALEYFQRAVELDSGFALAHVGLADAYQLQIGYSGVSPELANAKAEIAINKALALDDKLGEAYASMGLLKRDKGDYSDSEAAFKQALLLNPNYATAYQWYWGLLGELGRYEEASHLIEKALALDPLSPVINTNAASDYISEGRYEEAMMQFEKLIEIYPASPLGYSGKARIYRSVYARLDKAEPLLRKTISLDPNSPMQRLFLSALYLNLGDEKQGKCLLDQGLRQAPDSYFPNILKAMLLYSRGQYVQALSYANKAQKIHGSRRSVLALLRDLSLSKNDYKQAQSHYEKAYPALLAENKPTIDNTNIGEAVDLAYVLQLSGNTERAQLLLDRSLTFIHNQMRRLDFTGYGLDDVSIYAIQGEKQLALTTMRQAIDEGWRVASWFVLDYEPNLSSIRNEPEFQVMREEIRKEMAEQLARVRTTRRDDEVCVNP